MTKCGVIIIRLLYSVPHVLYVSVGVVHKNMPYDDIQVYIHVSNNSGVCTSA